MIVRAAGGGHELSVIVSQ